MVVRDLDGEGNITLILERLVIELPGITSQDGIDIQAEGIKPQAGFQIKSGTFNIHSIPLYVRKTLSLIKSKMGIAR